MWKESEIKRKENFIKGKKTVKSLNYIKKYSIPWKIAGDRRKKRKYKYVKNVYKVHIVIEGRMGCV